MMNVHDEKQRLSQSATLAHSLREITPVQTITVFERLQITKARHYSIVSSFINGTDLDAIMELPATPFLEPNGRFNTPIGLRTNPIVFDRYFDGIRQPYLELSEEFRLFHNLYDARDGRFIKIFEDGNDECVATIDQDQGTVKVRAKEILEFLAARESHLAIRTLCLEFSANGLDELGFAEGLREYAKGSSRWRFEYCDFDHFDGRRSFTRLLLLRLLLPRPKSSRERKSQHETFIIGVNENGDEIEHTCDPDRLRKPFGVNPDAPGFLTPVSFRKNVLDKYRQEPSKYEITENSLQCGGLWYLPIDDDHDDKVVVWLGDLGERLPFSEQRYWRSFNKPSETGVSQTYFQRQLLAQMVDSDRPEHRFRHRYDELMACGQQDLGWNPLLPLDESEHYLLQDVRVPANDEQRDFDDLVLALAKILVDSINVKEFKRFLSDEKRQELSRSIEVLEAVTLNHSIPEANVHISFLRNLQDLRSSGSAHRKGKNYRRVAAKFGIEARDDLRSVFEGILERAVDFLGFLVELTENEDFKRTSQ